MRFNALWTKRTTLGLIWLALTMIGTATTAQAQLYIDVYPSKDNDNQTIWIFHGESGAGITTSIRNSGNYHARDSWKIATRNHGVGPDGPESRLTVTNFYANNKPTNQVLNLSPLFSSANNPLDIESIQTSITNSGWPLFTPALFNSNATNAPTMTAGSATKTNRRFFSYGMEDSLA